MCYGEDAVTATFICCKWNIFDVCAYLYIPFLRHDSSCKHMTWAQRLLADSFQFSQPHDRHSSSFLGCMSASPHLCGERGKVQRMLVV